MLPSTHWTAQFLHFRSITSEYIYLHDDLVKIPFPTWLSSLINGCIKFETHSKSSWFENNFPSQVCFNSHIGVRTFNLMSLYNFQIIKHMTELPMTSSLMRVNRDSLAKRYFQVDFGFWKMFTVVTCRLQVYTNCSAIVTRCYLMLRYYTLWEIKM